MKHTPNAQPNPSLQAIAHRRVKAKMGWYFHALIFLCVNSALVSLAIFQGKHWFAFPFAGWGLGLLIHGLIVWKKTSSIHHQLYQRMMKKECDALANKPLSEI